MITRAIVSAFVVLLSSASSAFAHDPWEANGLALNPAAPDRLALSTNRGIAFSSDGGATWHFLCRFALENFQPIPAVRSTQAEVMLGTFSGLETISAAGCDRAQAPTLMSNLWVADIQPDPTNPTGWFATTSTGGDQVFNGVFYSADDGVTWTALGELENGPFFKQVRVTQDASVMYVTVAQYVPPTETEKERVDYWVRRSDDDGAHWTSHLIEMEQDDNEVILLDVDPSNPDRVFIAIQSCRPTNRCFDEMRGQRNSRVMVSEDGGQTWAQFFEVEEVASFEINDEHAWVGDWWGGLWRMKRDGSDPELLDQYLKAGCILSQGDTLYVCGTDVFDFMLARSTDNGDTLVPVASDDNVLGNPVCGPSDMDGGLDVAATCRQEWSDLCFESFNDVASPPAECAPFLVPGRMDAGLSDPSGGAACDCTTAGMTRGSAPWGWALLGLGLFAYRSQRRRRAR